MHTRHHIFALMILAMGACTGKVAETNTATATADTTTIASDDSLFLDNPSAEYKSPPIPEYKSDADRAALKMQWAAAEEAEKAFLGGAQMEDWIKNVPKVEGDAEGVEAEGSNGLLEDGKFKKLTAKQLLHYNVFHPETWDQICAETTFIPGEVKGIAQYLPFTGDFLSERQTKAMKAKGDSIPALIVECIRSNKAVSVSMLHTVVDLKLREAILPLIDVYKAQTLKDDLILTAFVEMMEAAEFPEWSESDTYKEMHGTDENYRDWLPLTQANADKLIFYAKKFAGA